MIEKQHERIYAELPEDFIRRMRNWVRGRDGASVGTSSMSERVDNHTHHEQPIPTMFGEATDTEVAIRKLPQRYQEVVSVFWLYESRDIAWMAKATPRLRLWKLGPASFREWLSIGHERLRTLVAQGTGAQGRRSSESATAQAR